MVMIKNVFLFILEIIREKLGKAFKVSNGLVE